MRHHTIPARLLGIGLPLMMIVGTAAAVLLFDGLLFWEAAVLAIMLAPTDAGIGQAVVTNANVPVRIRQALNIESGLNDGLAMPFLLLAVSFVAETEQANGLTGWVSSAVVSLVVGALVGIAVGFLGGHLIAWGARSRWMSGGMQKISGVVLALLAYALADGFGGNGFIAAFCMGAAAANAAPPRLTEAVRAFEEIEVEILMILTFMVVYGATMLPLALDSVNGIALIYALLSLAVIRPLTVALSLVGRKLQPLTVGFLGWFGPRGIASILYVFIVMESDLDGMDIIYDTVMLTVLISIFAHGMTAAPGAKWYASATRRQGGCRQRRDAGSAGDAAALPGSQRCKPRLNGRYARLRRRMLDAGSGIAYPVPSPPDLYRIGASHLTLLGEDCMKDTLIPVGAKVECTDGHAGFVSTVIVDPVRREVTHLVVQTSKDADRMVHLDKMGRTDPRRCI